jgi:HEAT repeat protein
MPAGRPVGGFRWTAASTTAAAGADARALTAPAALDDGDPRTVWSEGLGGDGRGEFLTARSSAGRYRVRGLRILPGDTSSPAAFKARNRVKALSLVLGPDDTHRFEVDIPEDPAAAEGKLRLPYWIVLPAPVDTTCVTVVIREVYRGTDHGPPGGGGTTAIADLDVFTELDDPAGVERLIADTAAGGDCGSRIPLLVDIGEPAVMPAAHALLAATGVGRECLVETLARIGATTKSGVALDALASALAGATPKEERLVASTLAKAPSPPVRAVADLLGSPKATGEDRARAARTLAELPGPEATAALLGAVGDGAADVRLEIVQALGRAPAASVPALIAALERARGAGAGANAAAAAAAAPAASPAREADLLRVLPPLVRRAPPERQPAERDAALEALRRSLDPGRPFEVRARAVMALGALGGGETVVELRKLRDGSDDPVLRYLATRELADSSGAGAVGALREAVADGDPRVRETAALGLGLQRDGASEARLIQAAKEEPWPFVRRAQLDALSRMCGVPARNLMVRAHERDVDEVRRAALVGLVRCRDTRAREVLFATLKGRRAGAPLRELAAALVGEMGDATAAPPLGAALAALVNEAEGDLAIEGVAVAALRALGQLGGPEATAAAVRLAHDAKHPYQQAAVEVLAQICDPDAGARTLTTLRTGKDVRLGAAAESALNRCRAKASTK